MEQKIHNATPNETMKEIKSGFLRGGYTALIIYIANILFFVGMYYQIIKAMPTETRVREIVKEELVNKFSITDGEVLKAQFQNLNNKVDEIRKLVEQHMMSHK